MSRAMLRLMLAQPSLCVWMLLASLHMAADLLLAREGTTRDQLTCLLPVLAFPTADPDARPGHQQA